MGIFLLKNVARLPLRFLYLLSGIMYVVVFHIIRYRKNVVLENLRNAFPEKSEHEIRQICKQFFWYLSELTIETVKMRNMNADDFNNHFKIKNPELLYSFYEQGKSLILLTMHYNNWEWSSFMPAHLKHLILGVYKPLHNNSYNTYFIDNRKRFGAEMVPTHKVLRRVQQGRAKNEIFALWLAGDQTPPMHHKFWLTFMNQETVFYQGPAIISRKFNYPVIFQKTTRKSRGNYEVSFELLIEHPENFSEAEIMKKYIIKMEETIKVHPEYYLWSHKRWKHKRPEGVPLQD